MHKLLQILLFGFAIATHNTYAEDLSVLFDGQVFLKRFEAAQPNGDKLIEFVRDGETIDNWTKLIGYRYQQFPRLDNDAKKAALALAQVVKANNPGAPIQVMAKDDEAIVDFLLLSKDAKFMEFNIFKHAKSRDGSAVVSFQWAYRFPPSLISPYEFGKFRNDWINLASSFDMNQVRIAFEKK